MNQEYRIIYRRYGWTHAQSRVFQRRFAARRLFRNLLNNGDRPDLAPIAEIAVERRWVGVWERDR